MDKSKYIEYKIYLLISPSGHCYVGQTKQKIKQRFAQHKSDALVKKVTDKNQCHALTRAIRKYEFANFQKKVILEVSCMQHIIDNLEELYIKEYNSLAPNGYNLTSGGKSFNKISEETRQKLSNIHKGKTREKNKRLREEDKDLPKYLVYYEDKKGYFGYRITCHPKCPSKAFTSPNLSIEEKFKLALEYLDNLNNGNIDHQAKVLPKYITKLKNGYRIRKQGVPVKVFTSEKLSDDEKLTKAKEYINSNMQFRD